MNLYCQSQAALAISFSILVESKYSSHTLFTVHRTLLPSILLIWQTRLTSSTLNSLLILVILQNKLPIHSRFSSSLWSLRSCNHFFLWSQIKMLCLYHPTTPWVSISITEVELQHSITPPCSSHLCGSLSPHSFGVTSIAPNCKFLALTISPCGATPLLSCKIMKSLQVDQHPLPWLSSVYLLVSQVC